MEDRKHVVVVGGAIHRGDKYLMQKRSQQEVYGGTLGFAGGSLDIEDESADDVLLTALRREIREEVNVEVDDMRYVFGSVFYGLAGEPVLKVLFLCRYVSGEAQAFDPTEVESVHWLTYDEILAHPDSPEWTIEDIQACERLRQTL